MRIITGASGQLGFELSEVLKGDIVKVYNTKEVQGGYKLLRVYSFNNLQFLTWLIIYV